MSCLLKSVLFSVFIASMGATVCCAQTSAAFERSGDKAFEKGEYYNASFYYNQAFELGKEDLELIYKLANSYMMSKDYRRASTYYSRVVVDDRTVRFALASFYLAESKKHLGLYETAKNFYKQYLDRAKVPDPFYKQKATDELVFCDSAMFITSNPFKVKIENCGDNINSEFSDFAAQQLADSILFYTSGRFPDKNKDEQSIYRSRIMKADVKNNRFREAEEMESYINSLDQHNASASVSNDYKIMVFCRCVEADTGSALICSLYESAYLDREWNLPVKLNNSINLQPYTSTQPCIVTNGVDGYTLYFVSNRPGGKGKLDIWQSFRNARGDYSEPVNLSDSVNSYDDEASPFYYLPENALYFSSKGKLNIGGFDILKSNFNNNQFGTAVNVGSPVNSSYDDLFFSFNRNDTTGYLTSNRPGSMFIRGETCCYDVYQFKFTGDQRKKWLIRETKKDSVIKDSVVFVTKIDELDFQFPLKLYFDNDQPDPRTTSTVTDKRYDNLFVDFNQKQKEYETIYSSVFKKENKEDAIQDIKQFFEEDAINNYNNLNTMCAYFLSKLDAGKTVRIKIRGAASPLAASYYNFNLSERRIVSLLNYFRFYKEGALVKYLDTTQTFQIEKEPMGETESPPSLDSKLNEKIIGVYSPDAARQRYIEIMAVAID